MSLISVIQHHFNQHQIVSKSCITYGLFVWPPWASIFVFQNICHNIYRSSPVYIYFIKNKNRKSISSLIEIFFFLQNTYAFLSQYYPPLLYIYIYIYTHTHTNHVSTNEFFLVHINSYLFRFVSLCMSFNLNITLQFPFFFFFFFFFFLGTYQVGPGFT